MKRNHPTYRLTCRLAGLIAALGIAACTSEEIATPAATDNVQALELSGVKSHVITRAGDDVEHFEAGTRYWLHGVSDTGWSEATERGNHTIDYGAAISLGTDPKDFYGITYGSPTALPGEAQLSVLSIVERVADDHLPDLMYSNNLKGQTASGNSRLEMNFRHAMSKLKFMIVKQDESADEVPRLENVRLKKIEVKGTHASGTLDVEQGKWTYPADDAQPFRTAYDSRGNDMAISTTSTSVAGETLVFPNEDGTEVTITVTLTGFAEGETERIVDYPLRRINDGGTDIGPFLFEQNHEYTLLITVLRNDVRTIAIVPQVYDWLDVEEDHVLGQPVTFANLMWMDRNLGAKSADCENEWEACRGYYYQYARNIPYILDKEKYDEKKGEGQIYQYLYTYDQNGEKVYGYAQAQETFEGKPVRYPNIAINPGDEGIYNYIRDVSPNRIGTGSGVWLFDVTGDEAHSSVNQYWTSSTENHPCPKGWRLPTRADYALFLPERDIIDGWSGNWYGKYGSKFNYTGNTLGYTEDEVHGPINGERAIYIIKRKGEPDCYRIRILLKESKTKGKWYYEFAYFSGDASMSFEGLTNANLFVQSDFDWSTPTAIMQIPACGFIYTNAEDKLYWDGTSTVLRTSEWSTHKDGDAMNWVCYLRDTFAFGIYDGSRQALGDQIRCVRDITVNKD